VKDRIHILDEQKDADFWSDVKSTEEPKISEDERAHITELVTVPQTKRTSLRWNKDDNDLFAECPEPFSQSEALQRLEYNKALCQDFWSVCKRGDSYLQKCLQDHRLTSFDALDEEDQKLVLDHRQGSIDDLSYRKHRTELHQAKIQAESTVRRHRRDLEAYLKLPSSCELADDEEAELNNLYQWLLFQINFDSIKWLQIPRTYNRTKMICEVMMRLYIDGHFSCTFLQGDQIQSWFKKDVNAWRLLLEKNIIFIALRKEMETVFWDLLFDEVQRLVTGGKSVIFISDKGPAFPTDLLDEFRSVALPLNKTFCKNMKFDRQSFEFQYTAPTRTEAQGNGHTEN